MIIKLSLVAFLTFVSLQASAQKPPMYPEAPERWSEPVPIKAIFDDDSIGRADSPTVTADGKTLYFGAWSGVTHLTETGWTTPVRVPYLFQNLGRNPVISPNGKRLFFTWWTGAGWFAYYCDWDISINGWGPVQDPGYAINYPPNQEAAPGADAGCFLDDTTLIVLKGGFDQTYITSWHSATSTWDTAISWGGFVSYAGIAVTPNSKKIYTTWLRNDTTRDGKYYDNFDLLVSYHDTNYWRNYVLNISLASDSLYFAGDDSGRYEGFPSITADGKTLFFEADYQGKYTIYESHLIIDENGDSVTNALNMPPSTMPNGFQLLPAYPNPFNPTTSVEYLVPKRSNIQIYVYDILGRKIKTLYDGVQTAGEHHLTFDSTGLSSGVYFLLLETPEGVLTSKIALIK